MDFLSSTCSSILANLPVPKTNTFCINNKHNNSNKMSITERECILRWYRVETIHVQTSLNHTIQMFIQRRITQPRTLFLLLLWFCSRFSRWEYEIFMITINVCGVMGELMRELMGDWFVLCPDEMRWGGSTQGTRGRCSMREIQNMSNMFCYISTIIIIIIIIHLCGSDRVDLIKAELTFFNARFVNNSRGSQKLIIWAPHFKC